MFNSKKKYSSDKMSKNILQNEVVVMVASYDNHL